MQFGPHECSSGKIPCQKEWIVVVSLQQKTPSQAHKREGVTTGHGATDTAEGTV